MLKISNRVCSKRKDTEWKTRQNGTNSEWPPKGKAAESKRIGMTKFLIGFAPNWEAKEWKRVRMVKIPNGIRSERESCVMRMCQNGKNS